MKNHGFMMLVGCVGSLLLIFLLPAFGVSMGVTFTVAIVVMLACHLFMGHGMMHDHERHEEHERHQTHEQHKQY